MSGSDWMLNRHSSPPVLRYSIHACCRVEGMTRRNVLKGVAASALAGSAAQAAEGTSASVYLELKYYQLHNTPEEQSRRLTGFLGGPYRSAVERSGAKLIGAFTNHIGMEAPYVLTIAQFKSLAVFQASLEKLTADTEYQHALSGLDAGTGYPYQRIETSLLKTFSGMPEPLLSPPDENKPPRVFEIRRYESQTEVSLARKVRMFNSGEIGIFQRLGMRPVFFGEMIVGQKMPDLIYMLSFDDLTARENLWKKFGSDPEWKKLSSPPEMHDDKVVSNISNAILQPLKFSLMR
jgi:hypothetical protein